MFFPRLPLLSSSTSLARLSLRATSASKPRNVQLTAVPVTAADYDELLHWALNCFTYVEPIEILMGITAHDARPYYEYYIPKCIESGLTIKVIDEKGLFAGYRFTSKVHRGETHPPMKMTPLWAVFDAMLTEGDELVWKQYPEAQKLVQYHGALIVPSYQGGPFAKDVITAQLDHKKLKAEGFYGAFSTTTNAHSLRMCVKAGHEALPKVDMSKYRMPDGRPVPMPADLDAPVPVLLKF